MNPSTFTGRLFQRVIGKWGVSSLFLFLLVSAPLTGEESVNRLTPEEIADGWKLLFDGTSIEGWRGFGQKEFPRRSWVLEDGCLKNLSSPPPPTSFPASVLSRIKSMLGHGKRRHHLITRDRHQDFDFRFQWKTSPGGNSGVKYFVIEYGGKAIGREYQIIHLNDPNRAPDRNTASFYSVLPASSHAIRAAQFNQGRIVVCGDRIEHWLNNEKVLEYQSGSDELKAALQDSKFRYMPGFENSRKGHLLLQDHGDVVWFRDLKILNLSDRCVEKSRK